MDGMEIESASKKLANLHPSMPLDTRIAVVGGGPSGLSAALALTKLGYEHVTVFESQPTVGGMCASAVIEGYVYDLGGQVLARESSPTLSDLMSEMRIEMEDLSEHKLCEIDCSNGQYQDVQVAADYIALMPHTLKLQAEARATGKLGIHALSDLAHEPADEYLRKRGVVKQGRVPTAVAKGYTASGYGYPADMPYAYLHEFARTSMMGKLWRVKGGYNSFWQKIANCLPDVRCDVEVERIDRSGDKAQIHISSRTSTKQTTLEFDKVIVTGSLATPRNNQTYTSLPCMLSQDQRSTGILNYTSEEEQIFSKVRTIEFYTTVLKVSGLDLPVGFYYPKIYADDPSTIGHPVSIQRFYADTDIYLFWSYGNASTPQNKVTELLLEDVKTMGGKVTQFLLQRKWKYFPHVNSSDMADGFYDKMNEIQGKSNTYFVGALLAFELTERNVSYAFNLVGRCFGTVKEWPYYRKLMPGLPLLKDVTQRDRNYDMRALDELPGFEFPDLPSLDEYLFHYARDKVVKDRVLYTWLDDEGREADHRTFAELDMRANIVARCLLHGKSQLKAGDRVMLLHPPGLHFIEAFFGCLRARVIPVPLIPPNPYHRGDQDLAKVENIAKACDAKAILSTFAYHAAVRTGSVRNMLSVSKKKAGPTWPSLPWHYTDSWIQQGRSSWNWPFNKTSPSDTPKSVTRTNSLKLNRESPSTIYSKIGSQNGEPPRSLSVVSLINSSKSLAMQCLQAILSPSPNGSTKSVLVTAQDERSSDDDEKQIQDSDFGPPPNPSDICFLQFTSGSTGDSKGVMISHGGLIHNLKLMHSEYKSTSKTVLISWLPQYHDMGLIGGLFTSLISGATAVLFSPTTFIRKPMLWLDAMDRYKGTHSAGPNFAFELIVRRYQQLQALGKTPAYDLSSLRFLMNSAEPLRYKTMQHFLELLHSSGLREQVLAPGYGLAENCVFVCVAYGKKLPVYIDWQGRVCCGYTAKSDKDVDIRIVDPNTFEEKDPGVEGEIWISSPSLGVGYWGQKELSDQTFCNKLRNAGDNDQERKFLRTGDLGRVLDGKLFVTGRIKDLIIVRGRNIYPADIEKVVENCSEDLRPGCSAAFIAPQKVLQEKRLMRPGAEDDAGVVVVAELRNEKKIAAELPALIKARVAEEFGIEVADVSFIKPRTISKTTSGKIRRHECLKNFSENTLQTVLIPATRRKSLRMSESDPVRSRKLSMSNGLDSPAPVYEVKIRSKQEIISFLTQIVAERTMMPIGSIRVDENIANYGMDSVGIVWTAQKLSDFLEIHVAAIDIYTAVSISELAETVSELMVRKSRSLPSGNAGRPSESLSPPSAGHRAQYPSKQDIQHFLVGLVAERTGLAASEISTTKNLVSYNIDSVGVVWASQKIFDHLGLTIPATDLYTVGCISELTEAADALFQRAHPAGPPSIEVHADTSEVSSLVDECEGEILTDQELSCGMEGMEPSFARRIGIASMQALGILYIATLLLIPAAFICGILKTFTAYNTITSMVLIAAVVPLAWITYIALIALVISIFGTCLLQENFTFTNAIPLWSAKYVKWWTLYRLQEFASTALAVHLRGTIFLTWWYRLLGASIGEGVQLETTDITDPGLLFVGNNVVIEEDATVQCHEVKEGAVYFGPVKINNEARVGAFSVIQRDTVVDTRASVTALGKTEVGQRVAGVKSMASLPKGQSTSSIALAVQQVFGLYLVGLVSTAAAMLAYFTFHWSVSKLGIFTGSKIESHEITTGGILFALAATFPWAVVGVAPVLLFQNSEALFQWLLTIQASRKLVTLSFSLAGAYFAYGVALSILTIALKWCLIGKLNLDKAPFSRSHYYRIWLVHTMLRFTHLRFVGYLSGTQATCIYLRFLGAKIGKMVSIRAVNPFVDPDLISIGAEAHLGDFAKIITSVSNADLTFTLGKVTIGKGCVLGAHSVIMPGTTLEDESRFGAMSVAPPNSVLQSGSVYVGVESLVQIYRKNASEKGVPSNSISSEEKDCRIEQMDPLYQNIVGNLAASVAKIALSVNARYFHRFGAGGKGTLTIFDNLPGIPRNEFFSPGRTYPVLVRHSNSLSFDDDARGDVRGASVRILQPDCGNNVEAALLDLTLKTGAGFHTRNLIDFVSYLTKNQASRLKHVEKFPHTAKMIWDSLKDCNSFAEMFYYSNLVLLFRSMDSEYYIKFRICPQDPNINEEQGRVTPSSVLPPETGTIPRSEEDTRPLRYLLDDFKARVRAPEGVTYKFQVQLRPIASSKEEIEDALDSTKAWDESQFPYIDVGELHLTEVLEDEVTERISINPRNHTSTFAVIPATSATDSASINHTRSLVYDISQYLRHGMPLPPSWQKLLEKANAGQKVPIPEGHVKTTGGACPAMSGMLPDNVRMVPVEHKPDEKDGKGPEELQTGGEGRHLHPLQLVIAQFLQPLTQIMLPFTVMALSFYPSVLLLAYIDSKFTYNWTLRLLPIAFVFSGLLFAVLSVLARWILMGQTREGESSRLWGRKASCDTAWQSIHLVLHTTFLALGKGSLMITWYYSCLGSFISSSAYIDTVYALNPDLLKIGEGSVVGHNALLFGHIYEGKELSFKSNIIGNFASVGTRALVLPGLRMEDNSVLPALGLSMKDEVITAY